MDSINRRQFVAGTLAAALVPAALESAPVPRTPGMGPVLAPHFEEPPLPEGVYKRLGSARFRFRDRPSFVGLTPNGRYLLTEAGSGTNPKMRLLEVATGRCVNDGRNLDLNQDSTLGIGSNNFFLSLSGNPETGWILQRRDLFSGLVVSSFPLAEKKFCRVAYDPVCSRTIMGHEDGLTCYDSETGRVLWEVGSDYWAMSPGAVPVFSGDGSRVAIYERTSISILDAANGFQVVEIERMDEVSLSHRGTIIVGENFERREKIARDGITGHVLWKRDTLMRQDPAFLPDDSAFLVVIVPGRLALFDSRTGKEIRQFPKVMASDLPVQCKALLSSDGSTAVIGYGSTIQIIDVKTGNHRPQSPDPINYFDDLQFTSSGHLAGHWCFYSGLKASRHSKIWSAQSGSERTVDPPHRWGEANYEIRVAGNGRNYAVIDKIGLRIFDMANPALYIEIPLPNLTEVCWLTDSTLLGCTDRSVVQIDLNKKAVKKLAIGIPGEPWGITLSADRRTAVALTYSKSENFHRLARCDVASGKWRAIPEKSGNINTVLQSADGRRLFFNQSSTPHDQYFTVLDGETGAILRVIDRIYVHDPRSISPDGRSVVFLRKLPRKPADDEHIHNETQLLEVQTGQVRKRFPQLEWARAFAISPDGRTLASSHDAAPVFLTDIYGERTNPLPRPDAAALRTAWTDLGSIDAEAAFRAICLLVQHPKEALPMLAANLKPTAAPNPRKIQQVIEELADRDYLTREAAERELATLVDEVRPQLQAAYDAGTHGPEAGQRLERLLNNTSASRLRIRAHEALERIGTPAAKAIVAESAKDNPKSDQSKDAIATLGRWEFNQRSS